jgi:peptide-methionine (S)-S-oxide reductase
MIQKITLGGGCFWCLEAIFNDIEGVVEVVSGYAGGMVEQPTYEAVCSGTTGHAEVIEVSYDSNVISLSQLYTVFFMMHDPTTRNRQGADVGAQYRSIILYRNEEQREEAEKIINELMRQGIWGDPIVTELSPFSIFYPAEPYHQSFFASNQRHPYCQAVIAPKLTKLHEQFKQILSKP